MSFQPILSNSISLLEDVRFQISHKDSFIDPSRMQTDDSHVHNCYEIYVNVSGNVSFLHSNNLYMIRSADVIFSRPGEVHHCIFNSPCIHEHYCLWFSASKESPVANFINKHCFSAHMRLDGKRAERLLSLFSELLTNRDEFERGVLFFDILMLMKERLGSSSDERIALPYKMQKMLEYVNESFLEISSVNVIAERFHVSIPTVNRWFREYLHLSPSELIKAKKLSYAEKLIRNEYSVTDACFSAGFVDCSRFIGLFKRVYGLTPLQYKKALAHFNSNN